MKKINLNSDVIIKVIPLEGLFPVRTLNSEWSVIIILFHIKINRGGINQNLIGKNNNPIIVLNQLNEIFSQLVDGSKTENKLAIIFNGLK